MAIDFRIRPPYGESLKMSLFSGQLPASDRFKEAPLSVGKKRIPSAIAGSLDMMVQEMDSAGVDFGVLMGRKTNHPVFGNTSTSELSEICKKYPDRFIPFAGLNPADEDWREQLDFAVQSGCK
ncbi:MAG: amidohydrolase, partial [Mailhella sp.]